ncbi:shikimate kinase [Spirochaetia bacterium]|nr:shikimate kinase [Spirochaetia bacterium]
MDDSSIPGIILLTGPKHSGKTSVGRILAVLLGAGFINLDELIERQTGKSPRSLYKEGAEVFRLAETQALASLLPNAGIIPENSSPGGVRVVAAGGGLIDNPDALELLRGPGKNTLARGMVYLEVTADTAWERIEAASLLTGELPPFLNTENPRETHAVLHARRGAVYRELASLSIAAEGKTAEDIGREIAARIVRSPITAIGDHCDQRSLGNWHPIKFLL